MQKGPKKSRQKKASARRPDTLPAFLSGLHAHLFF